MKNYTVILQISIMEREPPPSPEDPRVSPAFPRPQPGEDPLVFQSKLLERYAEQMNPPSRIYVNPRPAMSTGFSNAYETMAEDVPQLLKMLEKFHDVGRSLELPHE